MLLLNRPTEEHQRSGIRLLATGKRIFLFMALLQCLSVLAYSQTTAQGKVVNESNSPIAGVTVSQKNSTNATTTDEGGNFTLRLPSGNEVLVFSFVGYTTRELAAGANMSVQLQPMNNTLGEVIVVGYGTQRRVSVSGAVDKISADALEGKPAVNVSQALQGTAPNLIIQQRNFEPGQGLNINIRGLGTLGNNSPLVVIDGIIGGDLNLLNPADIESVSVLKDAGTAAIYGSRSNNGVLLITTKKGRKNQKATLTYEGMYGITHPEITAQPVHAWENAYYKNESLVNSGRQPVYSASDIQQIAAQGDGDWRLSSILKNAPQQTHNVSFRGGGDNNTYFMSFGYMDQANNFIGPDYGWKRYNLRLNQSTEVGRFKLTTILSYVRSDGKDHSSSTGTLTVDASRVPLLYNFQDSLGRYLTNAVSSEFNPKAILENGGYRLYNNDEVFGNFTGELSITRDLKLRGVFGGTVRSNHTFARRMELSFFPGGRYGQDREVNDDNYKSLMTNTQLIAEYKKRFGIHDVNVLVGGSNESFKGEGNNIRKTLTDPVFGIPTTGTVVDAGSANTNQRTSESSLNSMFGRAGYSYNDKYFGEFSFRFDGSSNFPKEGRWGFFPSVSAAWRLTEENFLSNFKSNVGDLKLRASYGILGNQNTDAYRYQTMYFNYTNAYGFNNNIVGGSGFLLGNSGLTWEKAATANVGLDAELFKRKLFVSFDVFDKTTRDILVPREDVPALFGASFPAYNSAEVRNRGWEINATYRLSGKNFRHTFNFNIADNKNELIDYTFGVKELVLRKEEFEFVRRIGLPITVYQGYRRDGYFQTLDDIKTYAKPANVTVVPGDIKFKDKNGDGVIDDQDKYILGNPFPRYTFGFTYNVSFKGFDAQVFVQGVGRRDQMIRGELVEPFHVGYSGTMYTHQTDYWTPTNPNAAWPRLAEAGSPSNQNNYRIGSDIYLFDAAYARLKNVQIGYNLPANIAEKAKLKGARIYFTGQNLFTLTRLQFIDPENTEFGNSTDMGAGANSGRAYPLPVFYGMGLNLTF
ncbi:SusC/RagA family TonB-linked outer membrane protein [Flavisolibacter nicotianae]|uniref:SusC/RagA family TonB-linked outer membrane protein n=1 Tax=Flavisolibacter nicotianae TaxID=2364882 RepID=UPI0013C42B00|nr:TonB-dependent receptor [Flavisolibacter nicotianae]